MAKLGIPLVGVDPAIVLSYRDEYKRSTTKKNGATFTFSPHTEWLKQRLQNADLQEKLKNIAKTDRTFSWYLFPHCTESTLCTEQSKRMARNFWKIWTTT